MRFIGNKEKLLNSIFATVVSSGIEQGIFCDFFSGTSTVGRFFKEKGFSIISSDMLYFSYVLQRAYIATNTQPTFHKLLPELKLSSAVLFSTPFDLVRVYLSSLAGRKGFIYRHYTEEGTSGSGVTRKYFSAENGKKIDAIRQKIEEWHAKKKINEDEYYVLIAALIESVPFYANISGVYGAFLKTYDPRSLKPLEIKPMSFYPSAKKHQVYHKDSMQLLEKLDVDVLYLDPPYNERQYAPNYHLLETIARYDSPSIRGVTGMRDYSDQKSVFCNKTLALQALDTISKIATYKRLVLSYNSEGLMSKKEILSVLRKYGTVTVKNIDYARFKSNSNGEAKHKKTIQEQLYVLSR